MYNLGLNLRNHTTNKKNSLLRGVFLLVIGERTIRGEKRQPSARSKPKAQQGDPPTFHHLNAKDA